MEKDYKARAGDLNITPDEYFALIKFSNTAVPIDDATNQNIKAILYSAKYPNILHYAKENSKNIGTDIEHSIRIALGLAPGFNKHHDAYDAKTNDRVELKTITALYKGHGDFMDRIMSIDNLHLAESGIFQHIKPSKFDKMIGIIVFVDGIAVYMVDSNEINPSTVKSDANATQKSMGAQQAEHLTEGTLTAKQLQLVATIKGLRIADMDVSYDDLLLAYETDTVIRRNNENDSTMVKYAEAAELLEF